MCEEMRLLYELPSQGLKALGLEEGEEVLYCVPLDLTYRKERERQEKSSEKYENNGYLVTTTGRLMVLNGEEVLYRRPLEECERIRCEHQVGCGIITVTADGEETCIARVSMRQIVRISYAVRGAQEVATFLREKREGRAEGVTSQEPEKYCEKCGRALPGTSTCPYCEGKLDSAKKFFELCGEYVGRLVLISVLMLSVSGLRILNPIIQKNFIDNALSTGTGTWRDLIVFVALSLGILVFAVILEVWNNLACTRLGSLLSMSLREKLYYKIQVLSLSFINRRKPGELMNRVSRDTGAIRNFFQDVFGSMLNVLLTMIVALGMMLYINTPMTLISLVFVVLVFVLTRIFWHHIHVIFTRQWFKGDELSNSIQDIISGMRIVKTFGTEEREAEKFAEKSMEFARISSKNEVFWAVFFPILTFIMGGGTYVAVLLGGREVLIGGMSIGTLVQYMTYSGALFGPLGWMTHLPRAFMEMLTSMNRIYDVLDEEVRIQNHENSKALPIKGNFRFENVSFGYNTYEPVLENISFEVRAGEMIGLVGASGTGKSTLINLIMRLYDPDQGRIYLDGENLRDVNTESLHSQIGVVLQETFLFSGSILDNIRFAKRDATLAEVIQAAKAANAHDFICKTPDGYNTKVGEHGYNLSGGERQRIAIARAILNDPRLLILDEATSALDTESEFLIQQAINRLVKGRTTFAIAHRLSTLREADRLVVIDKHGIAEMGSHNELLEKKGIYYGLVTAQLKMAEGR